MSDCISVCMFACKLFAQALARWLDGAPASMWLYPHTGCEPDTCNNPDESPHALEYCRIKGLPDLNQDNPYVAETLHSWLDWIRDEYHIDGFRVDAAKHMPAVSLHRRRLGFEWLKPRKVQGNSCCSWQ
jgi:glycosidase